MTAFHTKEWLRKQARYYGSQMKSVSKPKNVIRRQYLMSDQEVKQGEVIETIFQNFDSDGSGSLDINELTELFRQNGINLDKETVRKMFQGNKFNLQKFKSMMGSDTDLKRFSAIIKLHRE